LTVLDDSVLNKHVGKTRAGKGTRRRKAELVDEDSFDVAPARTDWDSDVTAQHHAVAACRQSGDFLGEARARNALGLLGLRRGYYSSARIEFERSLGLLSDLSDDRWVPVVLMHVAECMIGVARYREAREVLVESLAIFRERGDAGSEAEALRLLGATQDAAGRFSARPDLGDPTP
jgi:hypothetical protein